MVFSNVLQKSSESSPEANSIQCALAAVEIMEKKFGEDSTFLVDFYAKFQLRKIFNLLSHILRLLRIPVVPARILKIFTSFSLNSINVRVRHELISLFGKLSSSNNLAATSASALASFLSKSESMTSLSLIMNFNLLGDNSNLFGKYLRQISNLIGNPQAKGFKLMPIILRFVIG